MKTPSFMKFMRPVAVAAALAITTVGIHAQPATALPNTRPCDKYFNEASVYNKLAKLWADYAAWLDGAGYSLDAAGARAWAHYYECMARQQTSNGDKCIIGSPISELLDNCPVPLQRRPSLSSNVVPNATRRR